MVINGNQWHSVAIISGNQWQSVAISGNQWHLQPKDLPLRAPLRLCRRQRLLGRERAFPLQLQQRPHVARRQLRRLVLTRREASPQPLHRLALPPRRPRHALLGGRPRRRLARLLALVAVPVLVGWRGQRRAQAVEVEACGMKTPESA